jgi:Fe-S cluster assembly protein SufD
MNVMTTMTPAEQALGLALPNRREEEWKWTDLRRLVDRPYGAAVPADRNSVERLFAQSPFAGLKGPRLVIANGVVVEELSKLVGIKLGKGAPAIGHEDVLLSLNSKIGAVGMTLNFEGSVGQPVVVIFVTTGENTAVATRLHLDVAEGASASVIEIHLGEGAYLHNPVVTTTIGKGARLDRVKVEQEAASAQHLSHVIATLGANAIFSDFTLTVGAALSRQNVNVDFTGKGGNLRVNGSYLLRDSQHADTRLIVDHKVPHCTSRELYKCVMQEKSRGVFQGKVIVRADAQKTDGKQSSHALLLSESAEFDAKPELEIYADDVVCGHGTTCGDLDHDHLFYLRSRGIPEIAARSLLVQAFLAEAIEGVENETVRGVLTGLIEERLV